MQQLGEILIAEGALTEHQLMDAIDEQRSRGQSLGRTLVELGMISESQLVRALAQQVGMEFVELGDVSRRPARGRVGARGAVPPAHCAARLRIEDDVLKVAMSNPSNVVALDDFRSVTRLQVVPVVATHDDVLGRDRPLLPFRRRA